MQKGIQKRLFSAFKLTLIDLPFSSGFIFGLHFGQVFEMKRKKEILFLFFFTCSPSLVIV